MKSDYIIMQYVFNDMLDKLNSRKTDWLSNVKIILINHGFSHMLNDPFCVNLKTFRVLFKEIVLDVFKQSWCNRIALHNFMFVYKGFKTSIDFELYLEVLRTL